MRSFAFLLSVLPAAAFAQDAAVADPSAVSGSPLASMLPLVLIFFVFYFLLIRPQQRKFKEHQTMLTALKKGDEVITGGGVAGKIVNVMDGDMVKVEIAPGVEVKVLKSTISTVAGKAGAAQPASKKKDSMVKNDNVVVSKEDIANDN